MNRLLSKFFTSNAVQKVNMAFNESQIVTGTTKLLNDISSWLMLLVPVVGTIFIVYFSIRRGNADEQDKKQWDGRIKTAIISIIIGVLASVIVNLISTYYGGGGTAAI